MTIATKDSFMPTADRLPPKNTPIEWIAPNGELVRGQFAGGVVWFPEGSPMYIYYTPVYWRLAEIS